AGSQRPGPVLEWTPASPGPYRGQIEIDRHPVYPCAFRIGLRPQDLVDRRERFNFFFCLVVRTGATVDFVPLFTPSENGVKDAKIARRGPDRSALQREVRSGHPAFAAWMQRQSVIYRRAVSPRPFFDVGRMADGLYAVFPNDVVYLGGARSIVA